MKSLLVPSLVVTACLTVPALAMDPVPGEGGLTGYVHVGAGYVWIENSVIAGNRVVDIDNATVDSLSDEPESTDVGLPVMGFDLAYTFGSSRSQVSLGNTLEDFLRFEAVAQIAYRKQFAGQDRISAGLLFSSPLTEVYADPYVVGVERQVTTRNTRGARLIWDRIHGSRVEIELTYRMIKIEDELSGATQLALAASERDLLDRNGPREGLQVSYTFLPGGGAHTLIPSLTFVREDLDGEAVAGDIVEVQVTYKWNGRRLAVSSNLRLGSRDANERNPIFGETAEHDLTGASVQVFIKRFCGVERLSLLAAAAGSRTDSNIDFYKADTTLASLGIFYRF